jgi:hypothetical protein
MRDKQGGAILDIRKAVVYRQSGVQSHEGKAPTTPPHCHSSHGTPKCRYTAASRISSIGRGVP